MLSTGTFPCPNCHEFISAGVTSCRYCSAEIGLDAADAAVKLQERVNRACDGASSIRNLAGAMWAFYVIGVIGYVRLHHPLNVLSFIVGWAVALAVFIVTSVSMILWQFRYGRISTSDIDYKRATRNWTITLFLCLLMTVMILIPIVSFLMPRE